QNREAHGFALLRAQHYRTLHALARVKGRNDDLGLKVAVGGGGQSSALPLLEEVVSHLRQRIARAEVGCPEMLAVDDQIIADSGVHGSRIDRKLLLRAGRRSRDCCY